MMQQLKTFIHVITTVLWEKWVEFKFEWKKITASALVSPLLYMIALGWGLGSTSTVTDRPYIDFLVPGIIALTTMNTSFSAVGQPLNVQRIFERSFDQLIISPTPMPAYIFGQMLAIAIGIGTLYACYSDDKINNYYWKMFASFSGKAADEKALLALGHIKLPASVGRSGKETK